MHSVGKNLMVAATRKSQHVSPQDGLPKAGSIPSDGSQLPS